MQGLLHFEGSREQLIRFPVLPLELEQVGEVAERREGRGIGQPKRLLLQRQSATKQPFGIGIPVLRLIDEREVVEQRHQIRMVLAQAALFNGEGGPVEWLSGRDLPAQIEVVGDDAEQQGGVGGGHVLPLDRLGEGQAVREKPVAERPLRGVALGRTGKEDLNGPNGPFEGVRLLVRARCLA